MRFPDVVMNQGPLPGIGRLPTPLHDVPDSRINYGSTLLGDITPYAYGEPGYLSSQNAYLHTPHRVQKVVPVLHLPEPDSKRLFPLSHGVDDSDLVFVMRLDRNSVFCKGSKSGRAIGTIIDPLINLPTLNYILAGIQTAMSQEPGGETHYWKEFLSNLDSTLFGSGRNWEEDRISLQDLQHIVRDCIRPFGIMRGSEKQGGQSEATLSPATWPVPFIGTLVVDGKESNVVNIWHHRDVSAGDDLVLRFDIKPLSTYTLNHYYKRFEKKTFDAYQRQNVHVWQLVPDVLHYNCSRQEDYEEMHRKLQLLPENARRRLSGVSLDMALNLDSVFEPGGRPAGIRPAGILDVAFQRQYEGDRILAMTWHQLGYWHVGKSLVMMRKYGLRDFYNDDMANMLKTNHLEITFQPCFTSVPVILQNMPLLVNDTYRNITLVGKKSEGWAPTLSLEKADTGHTPAAGKESLLPRIDESEVTRAPRAKKSKTQKFAGDQQVTGTLLRSDGGVENVEMHII